MADPPPDWAAAAAGGDPGAPAAGNAENAGVDDADGDAEEIPKGDEDEENEGEVGNKGVAGFDEREKAGEEAPAAPKPDALAPDAPDVADAAVAAAPADGNPNSAGVLDAPAAPASVLTVGFTAALSSCLTGAAGTATDKKEGMAKVGCWPSRRDIDPLSSLGSSFTVTPVTVPAALTPLFADAFAPSSSSSSFTPPAPFPDAFSFPLAILTASPPVTIPATAPSLFTFPLGDGFAAAPPTLAFPLLFPGTLAPSCTGSAAFFFTTFFLVLSCCCCCCGCSSSSASRGGRTPGKVSGSSTRPGITPLLVTVGMVGRGGVTRACREWTSNRGGRRGNARGGRLSSGIMGGNPNMELELPVPSSIRGAVIIVYSFHNRAFNSC